MVIKIKTMLWGGLLGMVFSIAYFALIPFQIKQSFAGDSVIGASFVPQIIAVLMMLLSAALIFTSVVLKKESTTEITLGEIGVVATLFVALMVYLGLLMLLGFVIPSVLLCVAMLYYQKVRSPKIYGIVIAVVLVVLFGFKYGIGMNLPMF